jgi:membrane protein DedA with SNARE-associated domain
MEHQPTAPEDHSPTESVGGAFGTMSSEERRRFRFWALVLAVLGSGSMIGVAFSLYLVGNAPLLLIALSPIGRHLVLVAPIVDPVAFVVVSVVRRMLFYAASFQLGRALGPAGLPWLEARAARFARFVRWLEQIFDRHRIFVVLTMAGPTISALAGISGMNIRFYLMLAAPGLVVRMLVLLWFAEWQREPIEWLLEEIAVYRLPGTIVLIVAIVLHQWWRRSGSRKLSEG